MSQAVMKAMPLIGQEERYWLMCPVCHKGKLLQIIPGTTAKNLPLFCKRCRHVQNTDISQRPRGGFEVRMLDITGSEY